MSPSKPEAEARENIDRLLKAGVWHVVDRDQVIIHTARGVTFKALTLKQGYGENTHRLMYIAGPEALVGPARKPNASCK